MFGHTSRFIGRLIRLFFIYRCDYKKQNQVFESDKEWEEDRELREGIAFCSILITLFFLFSPASIETILVVILIELLFLRLLYTN